MLGFLSLIPGLFTTVNGITNAISNERIKLIDAKTEQQRIATQENITSLQAKRDVLIAESGRSNINAIIRGSIGAGVALLLGKLYVWDKVIGSFQGCAGTAGEALRCASFTTDALDGNLWNVVMATIGFYFVYEASVNTARIIKS